MGNNNGLLIVFALIIAYTAVIAFRIFASSFEKPVPPDSARIVYECEQTYSFVYLNKVFFCVPASVAQVSELRNDRSIFYDKIYKTDE